MYLRASSIVIHSSENHDLAHDGSPELTKEIGNEISGKEMFCGLDARYEHSRTTVPGSAQSLRSFWIAWKVGFESLIAGRAGFWLLSRC
jgi:hypothetical protein